MHFREELPFQSEAETIWKRASNVEEIPLYWHGTRELKVLGIEGRTLRTRTRYAFGGTGETEVTVDEGSRTVLIRYVSGPFKGTQSIVVKERLIASEWEIDFTGVLKLLSRWNARHFRSGTSHALERLVSDSQVKD